MLFDSWELDKRLTIIEDATAERDLERHKEDWRNMIAHDLRNPLTNIFGTLRLLEDETPEGTFSPEETRMLGAAVRACRRMLELLNLYLDVAKLDAGLMTPHEEDVDLAELAKRAADEQEVAAREKGVALVASVAPGTAARADAALLSRVVQNLLGNALKFTGKGGRVEIAARRTADGGVELCVTDNGRGIPAEDFPRIFDRFYQSESRHAGRTEGTGLGLTFCREAVMAMKGRIYVQSIPGLGTQFVISLPR
jgi:signal transduction histidine kinase